jgi:hypothetical protein
MKMGNKMANRKRFHFFSLKLLRQEIERFFPFFSCANPNKMCDVVNRFGKNSQGRKSPVLWTCHRRRPHFHPFPRGTK